MKPAVVLLHGFPEFSYGWRKQIGPLEAAGFRVIAPDQRGYNDAAKPPRAADYGLKRLTADVVALIEAQAAGPVCLAGHDWGAAVAWSVAAHRPDLVRRLAILNVPHPLVMRRHLLTDPLQIARSWYIFFFQIPWLPEAVLRARGYALLARAMTASSREGAFGEPDLRRYREAWSKPGALTGMIGWYRALTRRWPSFPSRPIQPPTLILWGERDRFLRSTMARESLRYCARGELVPFPSATHWLQHEEPEAVNRTLIDFFSRP